MIVNNSNLRIKIFLIIALIISILLIVRLLFLASINPSEYTNIESSNSTYQRGDIYDKTGKLLASSLEVDSVYANPKDIVDKKKAINYLSKILDLNKEYFTEKINSNKNFIWVKRHISPKETKSIREANIKGIFLKKEYKRFYPNKNLASQIIGFCNIDNIGVEGIEKSLDSYLLLNKKNNLFFNSKENIGNNINLTIDYNVQAFSEIALKKYVIDENAESGTLIFMDGTTGEIISLANYPDFDPNKYTEYNQKYFRNLAVFNQYEPGSVFKIFSLSSALDSGQITANDYFLCNGEFQKHGLVVKDTGTHGMVNISKIFKYSCNVGTLEASNKLKNFELYKYLKNFGFGESTSTMLSGEQSGLFRDISLWSPRSMLAIPIGQEVSVNAIQMVKAATTFLNDGIILEPFIVKSIKDNNNKIIKYNSRKELRRVLKKGTSAKIISSMGSATDEIGGTVKLLKIDGLNFAAKSGTAEIYDFKTKKYADSDVTSSLITIFPLEKPRYIAYVVFHKPKKGQAVQWGGIIGAKILKEFLSNITGYIDLNSLDTLTIKEKDINITTNYSKIESLPAKMPNLKGLTPGEAIDIFSNINIKIKILGHGIIYDQIPKAEEEITKTSEIKLLLRD